ncbi:unnamed protein product [Dovyalis caffra]|uniref:Uncharacterized protein n=1 Tax=Dovyalis caffra TaxID=77055 RepID=A0AAV1SPU4_9ROSI|nr:unnamed protein product [Dovyalis caffra]
MLHNLDYYMQVLHGASGGMSPQVQARNQQLPGSTPDIKSEINPVLNPRAAGPEVSLIGIPGMFCSWISPVKADMVDLSRFLSNK